VLCGVAQSLWRQAGGDITKRPRKTVLCVGNDLVNLNLRCARLKKEGWITLSAGSGHDGLLLSARERIDAVVLDLNEDGSESALIAAQLKKQNASLPVLMLVQDKANLALGVSEQGDAIILKSDEERVLSITLKQQLKKLG